MPPLSVVYVGTQSTHFVARMGWQRNWLSNASIRGGMVYYGLLCPTCGVSALIARKN